MDDWEISRTHPSWCDCRCCQDAKSGGFVALLLLPFLPFLLAGQWAAQKKAKKEYEEQQKAYEEEQKLEKARQAAARYRDSKVYAEFLATERHHKLEIERQKQKEVEEKNYAYIALGAIPAIISAILLGLNYLVCLVFSLNSENGFSSFVTYILMAGLLCAALGVVGVIEKKKV